MYHNVRHSPTRPPTWPASFLPPLAEPTAATADTHAHTLAHTHTLTCAYCSGGRTAPHCRTTAGGDAGRGGDPRGARQPRALPAGLDPHPPQPDLLPLLGGRAHALLDTGGWVGGWVGGGCGRGAGRRGPGPREGWLFGIRHGLKKNSHHASDTSPTCHCLPPPSALTVCCRRSWTRRWRW